MAIQPGSLRDLAESPISYDKSDYDNPVADVLDGHLATLNGDTTAAAGLQDELKAVIEEAVTEVGKVAAAQKRYDEAEIAEADADGPEAQRAAQKELREAKRALDEAEAEWETKKAELLAKLADILAKILCIGGDGSPLNDDDNWGDGQDPTKPKSKEGSPSDKPSSDSPSSDSPGDSPSSDNPSGQTQLSSDTSTPTQQQQQSYPNVTPQQAQQQQPSAVMSPSAGMPQQVSPTSNIRPISRDKDRDKRQDSDIDRGVMPVATPVPAAVPIDRGTSGSGITTRDVSGKPSTSLSTSGQVPGSANTANNPRGGVGGMVGGAPPPIGSGGKSDTAGKRGGKRFDFEALMGKPDDRDQSVNSGSLSRDSLAATEKAREAEEDRMRKAMRDSVKRMMTDKKAG